MNVNFYLFLIQKENYKNNVSFEFLSLKLHKVRKKLAKTSKFFMYTSVSFISRKFGSIQETAFFSSIDLPFQHIKYSTFDISTLFTK